MELELLPDDSAHWFQLGIILAQQHQFEDAAAAFRHSLQLDPEDVKSVNNLAQSLWSLGRREEAIRQFRRMTAMSPESSLAWIELGKVLEEAGRQAAADDCYHKALTVQGNSEPDLHSGPGQGRHRTPARRKCSPRERTEISRFHLPQPRRRLAYRTRKAYSN